MRKAPPVCRPLTRRHFLYCSSLAVAATAVTVPAFAQSGQLPELTQAWHSQVCRKAQQVVRT